VDILQDQGKQHSIYGWELTWPAVIFGAGHSPALIATTTLIPLLIIHTISLNAIGESYLVGFTGKKD
jgi:hypothetical protein